MIGTFNHFSIVARSNLQVLETPQKKTAQWRPEFREELNASLSD